MCCYEYIIFENTTVLTIVIIIIIIIEVFLQLIYSIFVAQFYFAGVPCSIPGSVSRLFLLRNFTDVSVQVKDWPLGIWSLQLS